MQWEMILASPNLKKKGMQKIFEIKHKHQEISKKSTGIKGKLF